MTGELLPGTGAMQSAARWHSKRGMRSLNPRQPCVGFQTPWDVALPGWRWLPPHQRGPPALVLPAQRWLLGQGSSCQMQSSGLDLRPARPGVSGFLSIPGLAGVKNGGTRLGGRQAQGGVARELAQHMEQLKDLI